MEDKITLIREWLGAGSIDIFGKPLSGKDTVGQRLADELGARFLSSGSIIRAAEAERRAAAVSGDAEEDVKIAEVATGDGKLTPTNVFYDLVLPYFGSKELEGRALVLSSVGRWSGEEVEVMRAAEAGGHPIRVVVELELTDEEVRQRRAVALESGDRGGRADDANEEVLGVRLREYAEKTVPVVEHYEKMGLLVRVNGEQGREEVYREVVEGLAEFCRG